MIQHKLDIPIQVGDLANRFSIDNLEFRSLSFTYDQDRPVLSIVLAHKPSGWTHSVTYTDKSVYSFISGLQGNIKPILEAVFAKLAVDGNLPPGTSV